MKFFISVDVEGISGIVDGSMVSRKQGDYERGRKLMDARRHRQYSVIPRFKQVLRRGAIAKGACE